MMERKLLNSRSKMTEKIACKEQIMLNDGLEWAYGLVFKSQKTNLRKPLSGVIIREI